MTTVTESERTRRRLRELLAVELAPMRIRVNCIAPVLGETGIKKFYNGPESFTPAVLDPDAICLARLRRPEIYP